ncbi:hypothetical protein GCM10010106_36750 [Thermopolyspora flexuosa]|nr:hypothetical protein GCM10010106_36750 [Thermopolyspora flexuosa]
MGRAEREAGATADLAECERDVLGVEDPENREHTLGRRQANGLRRPVCQDSHTHLPARFRDLGYMSVNQATQTDTL